MERDFNVSRASRGLRGRSLLQSITKWRGAPAATVDNCTSFAARHVLLAPNGPRAHKKPSMADFPDPPPPRNLDEAVENARRPDDSLAALLEPPPRERSRTGIIVALLAILAIGGGAYWYFFMRAADKPA